MTVSIRRVGYLWRWIVKAGRYCSGGMAADWDRALTEATEAGEKIRKGRQEAANRDKFSIPHLISKI